MQRLTLEFAEVERRRVDILRALSIVLAGCTEESRGEATDTSALFDVCMRWGWRHHAWTSNLQASPHTKGIIIESVSSRGAALRTALQIYHSRVFQKTANTALRTALYLSGDDSITRRAILRQGVCHFCLVGKL